MPVQVSLQFSSMWTEGFMEMKADAEGVLMTPRLAYKIEGLQPDAHYNVTMKLLQVDEIEYEYKKNSWKEAGPGKKIESAKVISLPGGSRFGKDLMADMVVFHDIKLTTGEIVGSLEDDATVFVHPNHKYKPLLTITDVKETSGLMFLFETTQFIVVEKFSSQKMIDVKLMKSNRQSSNRNQNFVAGVYVKNDGLNQKHVQAEVEQPLLNETNQEQMAYALRITPAKALKTCSKQWETMTEQEKSSYYIEAESVLKEKEQKDTGEAQQRNEENLKTPTGPQGNKPNGSSKPQECSPNPVYSFSKVNQEETAETLRECSKRLKTATGKRERLYYTETDELPEKRIEKTPWNKKQNSSESLKTPTEPQGDKTDGPTKPQECSPTPVNLFLQETQEQTTETLTECSERLKTVTEQGKRLYYTETDELPEKRTQETPERKQQRKRKQRNEKSGPANLPEIPTPYNLFLKANQQQISDALGLTSEQALKACFNRWGVMTREEKSTYNTESMELANKLKQKSVSQPPPKKTSTSSREARRKECLQFNKGPPTPFFLFLEANQKQIAKKFGLTAAEAIEKCSERWEVMTEEEKSSYYTEANELAKKHQKKPQNNEHQSEAKKLKTCNESQSESKETTELSTFPASVPQNPYLWNQPSTSNFPQIQPTVPFNPYLQNPYLFNPLLPPFSQVPSFPYQLLVSNMQANHVLPTTFDRDTGSLPCSSSTGSTPALDITPPLEDTPAVDESDEEVDIMD